MNSKKLKSAIDASGKKLSYLSDTLGISYYALRQKLSGERQFKVSEAKKLSDELNLSEEDRVSIFLS